MSVTTLLPPTSAEPVGTTPSSRPRRRGGRGLTLVALVAAVGLLLFVLIGLPLIRILAVSFSPEGWSIVSSMLTNKVNRGILWNTIQLGIIVSILGTADGIVKAYAKVRLMFRGK